MRGRFGLLFPYLLFAAMGLLVAGSNLRPAGPPPAAGTAAFAMQTADPLSCPIHFLAVPDGAGVVAEVGDVVQRFCNRGCLQTFLEREEAVRAAGGGSTAADPVCRMEVNTAWGISAVHEQHTVHFCTEKCRLLFLAEPERYLARRCPVCDQPVDEATGVPATYLGKTFLLCSAGHRVRFKQDPARYFMHSMWGIPTWMYYVSIAAVLLVSFLRFEGFRLWGRGGIQPAGGAGTRPEDRCGGADGGSPASRVNLMRVGLVRRIVRSRPFRFGGQSAMVGAFLLILWAGLFGNQNPALNIAPLLTWTIWWCGLVIVILFAGKAWCYVCPWDAIATWMERLRLWKKTDAGMGLGLPWPTTVRNIWVATVLFVGLTWVELGFGVTLRPRATAYLGIGMLLLAILCAFLFERKSFCRYGCLVGRVSGLYALFSAVEVRSASRQVCRGCRGKECVVGSADAYGCPTFENPGRMDVNTYCIQCMECLQACPHDNLALNLRPWGGDLGEAGKPAVDEAYLALLMLAITAFHGLTMTPSWPQLLDWLDGAAGLGRVGAFSAGMLLIMGLPVLLYAGLIGLSHFLATRGAGTGPVSYKAYFVRYAYCLLPIALFYHLAHNLEHLLMEGPKVARLLSDPLGRGWNLLGTAGWLVPPLTSLDLLWLLQVLLVGVGHVYSLWAAQRISRGVFRDPGASARGQLPILVGMIAFSIFSLWLLKQPMEMRASAM